MSVDLKCLDKSDPSSYKIYGVRDEYSIISTYLKNKIKNEKLSIYGPS
jgi:hypothetical protein